MADAHRAGGSVVEGDLTRRRFEGKPDHPPEGLLIAKRAELLGISKGAMERSESALRETIGFAYYQIMTFL